MTDKTHLATIAALLGEPARANILLALFDGRALTAKELAFAAGVMPQTASAHLGKLTEAGLLSVAAQGRHRYFRLADPTVAHMLESIMAVRAPEPQRIWRGGEALRNARTCYDHLAGRLGVALADSLRAAGHLVLSPDGGEVSAEGIAFLRDFGAEPHDGKRIFCRPCLDWSERRPHLAGRVGAALAERCFALGWVVRQRDTRAVAIAPVGLDGFARRFGFDAAFPP